MTIHVFGNILTGHGLAANNRGETEGNITTLQKVLWNGKLHTTVSAEAIRWALRYYWQQNADIPVNRKWDDEKDEHVWTDEKWEGWGSQQGKTYIDDDLLGFMKAEGAKVEGEKSKSGKGKTTKRRGVLELTRAVSTTPYVGDITFNARSGFKDRTSLYGAEIHATRYQYGFAMTPDRLRIASRSLDALDGILSLGEVAGNHSRFLFDFSPESLILRLTHDPAPRILYCFEEHDGKITVDELVRKVKAGDIDPEQLYIGGPVTELPEIREIGPRVCEPGVKKVVSTFKENLAKELDMKEAS